MKKEKKLIKNISLIIYDFDGVMTDNTIIVNEDGIESVRVNRSDGLAISLFNKLGIRQIIISTEHNPVVCVRAKKLKINCLQGVSNKAKTLHLYCKKNNINLSKVIYVGNDINDLEAMEFVGYPVCPSDAHESIKQISKFIIKSKGGEGVIRELLEILTEKKMI